MIKTESQFNKSFYKQSLFFEEIKWFAIKNMW